MADTKREQIMQALLTQLKTTFRYAVRNHPRLLYEDLPACAIWDDQRAIAERAYNNHLHALTVHVDVGVKLGASQNPSVIANQLIGQVIGILEGGDTTYGGLCESVFAVSDEIMYPQSGDFVLGVRVVFEVHFRAARGAL